MNGWGRDIQAEAAARQLVAAVGGREQAIEYLRAQANATSRTSKPTQAPPHGDEIVRLTNVGKTYGKKSAKQHVLQGVSLTIYEKEFVAITGASGSGKSTLLQLIGGLDKPTSGEVVVAGKNLEKMRDSELSTFRNRTIGFVFQFFYMQPFLTMLQNTRVPSMFAHTDHKTQELNAREMLAKVGLAEYAGRYSKQLSGGQIQRAAIARALINNPRILLADEPTGNLDSKNSQSIVELFQKIRDELGTTVVIVTHNPEISSVADRVIHVVDGQVQMGGTT